MSHLSAVDKALVLDRMMYAYRSLSTASHHHAINISMRTKSGVDGILLIVSAYGGTKGIARRLFTIEEVALANINPIVQIGHELIEELSGNPLDDRQRNLFEAI